MNNTLLTGSQHSRLEQAAFERADQVADDLLGSILYITRNDARRSMVEDSWAASHDPLRLRAETLDAVVREWYEHLHGPVQPLSGQLNRRLAEYALDRTTAETDGALAGEPASAALADSFSSRFSLFDDAGELIWIGISAPSRSTTSPTLSSVASGSTIHLRFRRSRTCFEYSVIHKTTSHSTECFGRRCSDSQMIASHRRSQRLIQSGTRSPRRTIHSSRTRSISSQRGGPSAAVRRRPKRASSRGTACCPE